MRVLAAAPALLLVVAAATAVGLAPSAPPAAAAEPNDPLPVAAAMPSSPPSACLGGGQRPTDARDLLVVPLSQFTVEVLGPASDVRFVVVLCSGASLQGRLTGPAECSGYRPMMSTNVIGASNGQALIDIRCPRLGPGGHTFLIDTGASTFSGQARVWNAAFA